ncbi:hypothetical protein D3C85_1171860 [compost metagenome]
MNSGYALNQTRDRFGVALVVHLREGKIATWMRVHQDDRQRLTFGQVDPLFQVAAGPGDIVRITFRAFSVGHNNQMLREQLQMLTSVARTYEYGGGLQAVAREQMSPERGVNLLRQHQTRVEVHWPISLRRQPSTSAS